MRKTGIESRGSEFYQNRGSQLTHRFHIICASALIVVGAVFGF
jgi:hypothetical protein